MEYAFICAVFSVVNNNLEIILIRKFRSSKMNIFSSNSSRVSNVKSLSMHLFIADSNRKYRLQAN